MSACDSLPIDHAHRAEPPAGVDVPLAERPVFVLAPSWRCGSTLLQRYLNATGAVFVWGENHRLVARMIDAFRPIREHERYSAEQRAWLARDGHYAWIASLNPEPATAIAQALRSALLAYYAGEGKLPRWGFKEVCCTATDAVNLLTLFPHGRILFLVRAPDRMLASAAATFWYGRAGGASGALAPWMESVSGFSALADPRILTLRYEDLLTRPEPVTEQIAAHVGIAAATFTPGVLAVRVRGGQGEPRLGSLELEALADPALAPLARHYYPDWQPPSRR